MLELSDGNSAEYIMRDWDTTHPFSVGTYSQVFGLRVSDPDLHLSRIGSPPPAWREHLFWLNPNSRICYALDRNWLNYVESSTSTIISDP